jgi:hypothetical protein
MISLPIGARSPAHPTILRSIKTAIILTLGALGAHTALADGPPHQNVEFALDSSLSYDSNPNYGQVNGGGAFSNYTGGSLFLNEDTPRFKALVGAIGGYTQYEGSASSYGFAEGSLNARAEYAFIPERFYWTASELFGQNATNAYAGPSLANQTNVNIFSTGPQFILPLGDEFHINAGGSVGEARYAGQTGENSNRENLNIGLSHPIERFDTISVQGTYQKLDYVDVATNLYGYTANYAIENVFFRWFEGSTRNDMTIELGEGRVTQGNISYNSPTIRLNLNRLVTAHWNLGVAASEEYSDTAQQITNSLINNRNPLPIPTPGPPMASYAQLTAQPIKVDEVRITAKFVANRTQFVGGIYESREDYLDYSADNTTNLGVSGHFTRRLSFKTDLSVSAGVGRVSYAAGALVQRTENIGPTLAWRATPSFIVSAGVAYERRISSNTEYSYSDMKATIGVRWSPFHNVGSFNQAPSSFSGVGGSSMSNIFSVPSSF